MFRIPRFSAHHRDILVISNIKLSKFNKIVPVVTSLVIMCLYGHERYFTFCRENLTLQMQMSKQLDLVEPT